ncbi:MAG TPA: hypothetical protein VGQ28_05410 [Thermoanaerobaculia bacterium]|jgi:hypothetical protein|nr:hypothetical protein [Thermoanaerobaculia bacterium]
MRNRRTAAALLLLALAFGLAAPAAFAGDAPWPASLQARHAQAPNGVLESLWSLVTRLFSATPTANIDEGCGIDPLGRCLPHTEAGCRIDPLGACLPDH